MRATYRLSAPPPPLPGPLRAMPRPANALPATTQPMLPRALHYIDAIARAGSVRQAAERLHVAASAVNRQLIELEEELGVELFERLPRGMRATAAGELLLAHIRRQRGEAEALQQQLQDLRGARRGQVRIGAVEAVARGLLPELLLDFHRLHARIGFTVSLGGTVALLRQLMAETLELAIVYNPPDSADVQVMAERAAALHAVMAPDHPLAGRASLRLADCLAYPIALSCQETGSRALIEEALSGSSLRIEPVLESDSFEMLSRFAAGCGGVSFQSAIGVAPDVARGALVAIPLAERALARGRLALVARRGRTPSPAAARLAEHVAAALRSDRAC
ncbi:LysR family transcriptional regulator [Roseomonas stagni]|uniref:LysR family transcriptional regulator n=1 Tax=Falsiroseomonas algicola TaxID=2716930 RepID=A0A6M1LR75_9PROT|nr:LysR family transcriptional regulator [Falsiroseomonas algicola]NGM22512.1 LysR family transcriptional regulator [Falsiroseomonas algicola]